MQKRAAAAAVVAIALSLITRLLVIAQSDPLSSWNDGPAKQAIAEFVRDTTTASGSHFVPVPERVATFDQDGTLWVEHPMYSQVMFCLDRMPAVVRQKPELANVEPLRTVLSGNHEAIAKLPTQELLKIVEATLSGIDTDRFQEEVTTWLGIARDPRWKRPYTELTYLPMLELMRYLRTNGYTTDIVTGGGQDFVRTYAESAYGIPPNQVVGTAGATKFEYDPNGKVLLMKEPKLLLNDNGPGKVEGIHLMIGRRPRAAFGNSTGDREMLEYTTGGSGRRLAMLVLHDDAMREYAYGPAHGLPETKVGTFSQTLYDEAKAKGWIVVSMKNDWSRIFAFEQPLQSPTVAR